MYTIEKTTGNFIRGRERMIVKGFRTAEAMNTYLCGPNGCGWTEHTLGLKPGTYAYVGGRWCNVKTLDPLLLAHV